MSGLGIDFGAAEPPQSPPRPMRRCAELLRRPCPSDFDAPDTPTAPVAARIAAAPLRENRLVTNTQPSRDPRYPAAATAAPAEKGAATDLAPLPTTDKARPDPATEATPASPHPLPCKPALRPHLPVPAVRIMVRADTPSDTSRTPTMFDAPTWAASSAHAADMPLAGAGRCLVRESSPAPPKASPNLPVKPPSTPSLPRERDTRVGIEVFLNSSLAVEGGSLQGCVQLRLPDHADPATAMLLAQPRVRLVGYESLPGDDVRHVFYHHASVIDGDRSVDGPSEPYVLHGSPAHPEGPGTVTPLLPCYASLPDADGFYLGKRDTHILPFTLQLSMGRGAKGSYRSDRAEVGYIVIASVRVRPFSTQQIGVAHCFQRVELYPYLNPTAVLASAARPLVAQALAQDAHGAPVQLAAALHRECWIAGQRVYLEMNVVNRTAAPVTLLRVALVRTESLHRVRDRDASPADVSGADETVAEETLHAAPAPLSGETWPGVCAGSSVHFSHSLLVPATALSISRSRHVDVQYALHVSVGLDGAPLARVQLPVRIMHFISLDPPPHKRCFTGGAGLLGHALGLRADKRQMAGRVQTMESLRSPRASMVAAGHTLPPSAGEQDEAHSSRTTQHRRSLDFINSAIRSATARRSSPYASESPAGLGIELGGPVSREPFPDRLCAPRYPHATGPLRGLESVGLSSFAASNTPAIDEEDVSLQLGDETVGDVGLAFDTPQPGTDEAHLSHANEADLSHANSTMSRILDAYSMPDMHASESPGGSASGRADPRHREKPLGSTPHDCPATPSSTAQAAASSARCESPDVRPPTRTETRETLAGGAREMPRSKTMFTFATNTSPLKVKTRASAHLDFPVKSTSSPLTLRPKRGSMSAANVDCVQSPLRSTPVRLRARDGDARTLRHVRSAAALPRLGAHAADGEAGMPLPARGAALAARADLRTSPTCL
ncbi:hypothetical protein MSPP1_002405 [Malassezia sp. CBS 17886]|nr:hypothetical protein MSPP1_002405 [Malassezia sp. CBS 17886]